MKYILFILIAMITAVTLLGNATACDVGETEVAQESAPEVTSDFWETIKSDLPCCGTSYCRCAGLCNVGPHGEAPAQNTCCSQKHPSQPEHAAPPAALVLRSVEQSITPPQIAMAGFSMPANSGSGCPQANIPHEEQLDITLMYCISRT